MVRRLEELATMDGLTGLLNKRALLEMAASKLAAANRFHRKVSVLITDIDFFKKVNDTHGHDVGDVVIKGLGDVLRRCKDDLTRDNVMKQAASLDITLPMLLPGVKLNTSPTDYRPIKDGYMVEFRNDQFNVISELLRGS